MYTFPNDNDPGSRLEKHCHRYQEVRESTPAQGRYDHTAPEIGLKKRIYYVVLLPKYTSNLLSQHFQSSRQNTSISSELMIVSHVNLLHRLCNNVFDVPEYSGILT